MKPATLTTQNLASKTPIELAKKADSIVLDLIKQSHSVYRREIDHWQKARMTRESIDNPRTHLLQQVYKDAMLDTHLSAMVESRILRIQNKRWVITDDKGVADHDKSDLITRKWFGDIVRYAMESIIYEFSLVQLIKDKGEIVAVRNIPRGHVLPEPQLVIKHVYDTTGLDYTAFPDDLLFAKLYEGRGLLEKAAPLCILKRHSWASWDEFEQIFGMPIRIAKIASTNDKVKAEVGSWLEQMGTASYGVFPQFAEIDIKEANNRDAFNVFMKKIETVDAQNSILVNGQTMTSMDGSSYSQAEVHQKTQDEISEADLKNVLYWLNDTLLPVMRRMVYKIAENQRIDVERVTDPVQKIKTDAVLMQNGYRLSDDYVERTYGVELSTTKDPEPPKKD